MNRNGIRITSHKPVVHSRNAEGNKRPGAATRRTDKVTPGDMKNRHRAGGFKGTALVVLLTFIMTFASLLGAFADDLVNTVPAGEGYTGSITTFNDGKGADTNDTIIGKAPYSNNKVRQSTSTESATTFASGLPLSTIYIDQDKVKNSPNGKFNPLPGPHSQYLIASQEINGDGNTYWRVDYDAVNGPKMYAGTINELTGDLYYIIFPDAAILPDGSTADLKITYSNAKIVIDQRYAYDNTPYNGQIFLSKGGNFSYGGTDTTNIENMSNASGRQGAVNDVVHEFYPSGANFSNTNMKTPMIGKTMDATYQIVNKNEVPIEGTFIYAIAGINLDRDPYRGGASAGNNYGKPLWYINGLNEEIFNYQDTDYTVYKAPDGTKYIKKDTTSGEKYFELTSSGTTYIVDDNPASPQPVNPMVSYIYKKEGGKGTGGEEYHYFSESMSITGGQSSDYIYVRSNKNNLDDENNTATYDNQTHFYSQVSTDSNGNPWIIGNANMNVSNTSQASDTSYCSGFVTLADAAAGFKVTATGHGGYGNSSMNTNTFTSSTIWYRYKSGSGPHGRIELTDEGNHGGQLGDGGTVLPGGTIAVPNTYVVTEGKTVTYTMTPDIGYKMKKLTIGGEEVLFDREAVSKMKKGDSITVDTADSAYWTSHTTKEPIDPSRGQGILKYEEDGTYTFTFNHAKAHEEIFVEWEPTTADLYIAKIWKDNNDEDGLRSLIYGGSDKPKFKLQYSTNGGRNWNDVKTGETKNSDIANTPIHPERTYDDQEVPGGKVGGVYKDGTYYINNGTDGAYSASAAAPQPTSANLVSTFENCQSMVVLEDKNTRKRYVDVDGTYHEVEKADHPFTWEYLPVYTYDDSGIADRPISYRIVEDDDPVHRDYKKAQYFDSQAFELTSEKSKTWNGWQIYEDSTSGQHYILRGDGLYYEVSQNQDVENADGVMNPDPPSEQPDKNNLTPVSSNTYRTTDKAIPYQSEEILNEHTVRKLYVDVNKFWNDRDLLDAITTGTNDYERVELKFILSGETEDDPVDLNEDPGKENLELTVSPTETGAKYEKIDNYQIFKDTLGNQYAHVVGDASHTNGYYPVSGSTIDYTKAADVNELDLSPIIHEKYKVDDDNFGVCFNDLPTHDNGKNITYTVKEQFKIGETWYDAGESEVSWVTNGGELNPERDSSHEVKGYETKFSNTPRIEDKYVTLPITIAKRDAKTTNVLLEGAEFTIYRNAITGEKALDNDDVKIEGQTIYTKGSLEYVKRTEQGETEEEYYTFAKKNDGTYEYTLATPQPKETDLKVKQGDVKSNVVYTKTDGTTMVEFQEPGTYYIKETKAPTGYTADPTIYAFIVNEDLKTITLKDADEDHATSWWQKLYDMLFGDNTAPSTYTNWDKDTKTLTVDDEPLSANVLVRKYWEDNDDQDGVRPKDKLADGTTDNPKTPNVILQWTTTAHTAEGHPVYQSGDKKYIHNTEDDKYYEVIEEDTIGTFEPAPAETQPENVTETDETCQGRKVYKDESDQKYVFVDEKYHKVTTVDEAGSVSDTAANPQPDEDELELIQDSGWTNVIIGTEDPGDPDPEYAIERVSYAGGPVKTSQTDAYTWSNVKAYRDGKVVVYRVHETSPLITDGTYSIKYSHTSDTHENVFTLVNQNGTTHNQTVDVTNKHETRVINIEAYKTWNDEDTTKRREATLTLWKEVNGARSIVTKMENGVAVNDTGTVPVTDETDPVKTWSDLPAYEMGYPITYSIVETTIDGYKTVYEVNYTKAATDTDPEEEIEEEGSAIDASVVKRTYYTQEDKDAGRIPQGKKVGDESTTAAFRIENEETIDIDVEKTWVDGANANVTFELWRTTTPEAGWDKSKFKEETICYKHNENGNRISVQDYNALSPTEQANYTEQKGKNWSPYEDSTETTTVDGWKKVDSYEFAASRFEVSSTGDTKDYTFKNLPRQEVEVIDGKKISKDGANNKFAFNETDKKYYAVNSDGTISDTPADPQPQAADLSLSYLKYTYRILETPKLVRLAADQTDDFKVTNYNLHASSGFANVEVVKELQGRAWNAGGLEDKFYFELDPQSATDTTDPTHTIYKDDIPLPTRILSRKLYEGNGKYYVKDADDMYREVTVDTSTDPVSYTVADKPVNPQPKDTDLIDTGTTCEAPVQYAVDSTKDKAVGAIGRAADFKSIEFSDETVIPRGHTVEFNYKVREVYDILGTSLEDATNGTGKRDGISYADFDDEGSWTQAEHNLKIVVINDQNGKMTTTILWDGADETGAVPVFTNKYSSESEAKAWIEKEIANRPWVDYANGKGDAFQYEVLAISGSQLNVPGADHSQESDDSYTSKPVISNESGNPQDDIQMQSDTEYAFGLTGNKYTGDMLNSSGEGYFIYAIGEKDKATSKDDDLGLNEYKVDGLTYDDSTIYAKVKVTDNWDGTLSFDVKYYRDAACRNEITDYKVWIQDKFTGGSVDPAAADPQPNESSLIETTERIGLKTVYADANGNRYVKDGDYYHEVIGGTETKRLLSQKEIADMEGMSDAQKKANGYVQKNVAHFTNRENVDIPVVKEWVGGPAIEDVNLHLVRHLYEMNESFDEDALTYAAIEAAAKNWDEKTQGEPFWTTEGHTHIAKRGDFLKDDGTPDYDEGSEDTASEKYENIDKFNKDLPKYVKENGKMYRAVYKLVEDDTSDTYTTTYRSSKEGEEDTEGNAIFLGGETLTVTNTVTANNVAKIAAVKQFLGRNWANTDKFDFTLEPVGIGTYDAKTGALTGINDTTGKAKVPMPARYVNNNDPTDVKSISEYDNLPDDEKANYTKEVTDSADAISDDEEVDKNGHLERLASFDEIIYTVNDLQYDPVEKYYQGDFYYIMKEKLPEITADLYPVAYTSTTQTTEKAIEDKQLPTMASGEKLKTVKFSNGITYDCDKHTVYVKVRENRTGKLQTQIAYDYDDFKDISTGTQYTPVYTNRYDATGEYTEDINKYIMGRRWKDGTAQGEEEEQQDRFDFRMTPLAGAPFEDADKSEFPDVDTHSDDERDTDLEAGDAIHSARGAHVKRLKVTDENEEIQNLKMPKLKFRLSELGKTVATDGALKYSDGTDVPAGMAYDQFVYSFEETNDYLKQRGKDVKDLNIDPDTEYARVTVIDKGDGTLDHYVEIFEDRYCKVPRYIPGTETPATSPTFVNQLKRDLSITKAWADTPNSDVTMRLKWSVDGEHWYDADKATFLVGQDVTKTIKKDATGDALTVTWTDLPAYANIVSATDQTGDDKDLNDVWIYYTITEDPIDHVITRYSEDAYEEGDSYDDSGYEEAVNDVNPFKTEDAPSGDSYADRTYNEIIDQLYATNWREETEGTAQVGVVKQYIGKVWEDEEFTFEMKPLKSRLGSASDYTTYEDQVAAHEADPKAKVMPVLSNNKATANTDTDEVSVNEHAANFNGLVIKLSDLVVATEGDDKGKERGEFIYEIKEVIPDDAVEMTEGGKTYFVKKDEHGNIIKYTTDTHTAKIIAVDDGSGKLDITVSYDTRSAGEFVPVYTNYAMMPTPIDGTKTWIGGKKAEHQNGTVELDEATGEIKSDPEPTDKLGLTLKRKLVTSDGVEKPVTHDDAGRKLVVVWVKENPAQPEKPTGYWINSETEEKITDADYQRLPDEDKANYTQEMTPAVPASIDTQTGDDPTSTEKGNSGPYTYTIKAQVTEGGVTRYEDPLLNVCDTSGYEYEYYITETSKPKGYEKSESGMDVVNTNDETDNLKVSKTWDDAQGVDGTRPDKVIVHLYKEVIVPAEEGGQPTTKTVQVEVDKKIITKQDGDDKDVWSKGVVFEDLPLYDSNGNVIKYFVLEEGIGGYTATYAANSTAEADYKDENNLVKIELDGQKNRTDPESETDNPQFIDIKNSLTPATNTVKVTKVWYDQNDIDGARPDDVTFQLYKYVWDPEANSGKGAYKTTEEPVSGENGKGRPATQADVGAGIATKVGDTIKIEDLTLNGTADTGEDIDTVANETAPTNTYTWNGEWINLPLTENGKTILYIIKEVIPEGADSAYGEPGTQGKYSNDPCIRGDQIKGYTATNTYTPEVTSFEGIKEWVDGDSSIKHNNSADLPGSLTLWRTNVTPDQWTDETAWTNLGTLDNLNATLVPDAHVDWSSSSILTIFKPDDKFTITGLPKKDGEGKTYYYKVTESEITGYATSYLNDDAKDESLKEKTDALYSGGTVENAAKIGPVKIQKKFVDDEGNVIPKATLPAGFKIKVSYVWFNPDTKKFETINNKYLEIGDKTADADGFYTWTIDNVAYATKVTAEELGYKNLKGYSYVSTTADVSGDNPDKHPETNPSYAEFTMPSSAATITPGLRSAVQPGDAAVTFTNTYSRDEGTIEPVKIWDDNSNAAGKRPTTVTLTVTARTQSESPSLVDVYGFTRVSDNEYTKTYTMDGSDAGNAGDEWIMNEDGDLGIDVPTHSDGGQIITYVVEEKDNDIPTGYQRMYPGSDPIVISLVDGQTDRAVVTNAYAEFEITKQWMDVDGKTASPTNKRPSADQYKTMVKLYADGTEKTGVQPTVNDNGNGTYTIKWENLAKYTGSAATKKAIVYSAKEDPDTITGYAKGTYSNVENPETLVKEGSIKDKALNGGTITNNQLVKVDVVKEWKDNHNHDGQRPDKIKVTLYQNGVEYKPEGASSAEKELTKATATEGTSAEGNDTWTWTEVWTNLPYADDNGSVYNYTATETGMGDSEGLWGVLTNAGTIRQILLQTWNTDKDTLTFNITNDDVEDKTGFTVDKIWKDGSDVDKLRPATINYRLYQSWAGHDEELVKELPEDAEVKTVTNGAEPEDAEYTNGYVSVDAKKTDTSQGTLNRVIFSGLPEFAASGKKITYTIKEDGDVTNDTVTVTIDPIRGYNIDKERQMPVIGGSQTAGYTVTNEHKPVSAKVTPGAVKKITGRKFKSGDEFTFKLEAVTKGAPTPTPDYMVIKPDSGDEETISLGEFKFTGADMTDKLATGDTKTFTYKLTEVNGGKTIDDLKYDASEKTLKITVKRNADGTIEIPAEGGVVWGDGSEGSDTFTNVYGSKKKLTLRKVWVDVDADGTVIGDRPTSVEFKVTATIKDDWSAETDNELLNAGFEKKSPTTYEKTYEITSSDAASEDPDHTWQIETGDLPKYDAEGTAVKYEVSEDQVPPNYNESKLVVKNDVYTITNEYERVELTGTKIWRDGGKTHDNTTELDLTVYRRAYNTAGQAVGDSEEVSGSHIHWEGDTYTITGVPAKDEDGNSYTYWTVEEKVDGYDDPVYDNSASIGTTAEQKAETDKAYNGGKIINSALTSVTVTKKWDDSGYFEGDAVTIGSANTYERPDVLFTVTATATTTEEIKALTKSETSGGPGFTWDNSDKTKYTKEVTLTGETEKDITEWTKKIDNLPMYDQEGKPIKYTSAEKNASGADTTPEGFVKEDDEDDRETTNTPKEKKENDTLDLTVLKTDGITSKGLNGARFTVYQSNGRTEATTGVNGMVSVNPVTTVGEGDNAGKATVTFKKPGTYVIKETRAPKGYTLSEKSFTIQVDEELESIMLKKETDSEEKFWTWLYKLLFSDDKPESMSGDETAGFTLTVTDDPVRAQVLVDKVWDDVNDQDGLRKAAKDAEALPKVKLQYKLEGGDWKDATAAILGDQVLNKSVPDKDGKVSDGKTYTWKDLPAYLGGEEVTYRVVETGIITGYDDPAYSVDSFKLANPAGTEADNAEVTVTNSYEPVTASVQVSKLWWDIDNIDDKRVDELTFRLVSDAGFENSKDLAIDITVKDGKEAIKSTSDPVWLDLPVYRNGKKIKYTLTETTRIDGYEVLYAGTDGSKKNKDFELNPDSDKPYLVTVTNKHDPDSIRIWVKKEWNDNNDQDGKRGPVTVELVEADDSAGTWDGNDKDGNKVEPLTLDASGNYRGSFDNLKAVDGAGKKITYAVEEKSAPSGYDTDDATYSGNGTHADPFVVTNTRGADTITVTATKKWSGDAEFKDETRKDVSLHLIGRKGDGIAWDGGSQTISADTDADEGEKAGEVTWTRLPRNIDGEELVWEVYEDAVPGYAANIIGGTPDENGNVEFAITNTYVGAVAEVTATKAWYDDNNRDGIRSDVYFQLYRSVGYDGDEEAIGEPVKIDVNEAAADGEVAGSATWKDLPEVIAETESGTETKTTYVRVEAFAEGDNPSEKGWFVSDGADGYVLTEDPEPEEGTEYFEKKDEDVTTETTTERAVIYTVKEVDKDGNVTAPEGYESVVTQTSAGEFVISNIHSPKTTELSVQKIWIDNDDIEGFRPDHIKFRIKHGEKTVREVAITAEDEGAGWNSGVYTFTGLTMNENGEPIDYKVVELDSDGETELDGSEGHDATSYGYTVSVSGEGTVENPVVVTNTHKVGGKGTLTVTKAWEDDEKHKKETRGDVKLHLIKVIDGARTDAGQDKTIEFDPSEPDKAMTAKWTDLPTSEDGKPVVYTVEEYDVPQGYKASVSDTSVSGEDMTLTVTNTYSETPAFGEDVIYVDPLNPKGKMVLKSNTYDTHSEAEGAASSQSGAPTVGEHKNYKFTGWAVNYDENGNFVLVATYSEIPQTTKPTTSYIDPQSGKPLLISEETDDPSSVKVPKDPKHDNLVFVGWVKTKDVAGNTIFVAKYECKCEGGNGQQCDDTSGGGNGKGAGGSSKNAGVNTGDDNLLYFWITLFFLAAATLAFTTMRRRREYHRAYDNSGSR